MMEQLTQRQVELAEANDHIELLEQHSGNAAEEIEVTDHH